MNTQQPQRHIGKYLRHFAEPEHRQLQIPGSWQIQNALIVPAYDEPDFDPEHFLGNLPDATLLVLVVNAPEDRFRADGSDPPNQATREKNTLARKRTLELLNSCGGISAHGKLQTLNATQHKHLLVLDRISSGRELPHKQGVGLARKIAADCALRLYHDSQLASPWLGCTDADAELPAGYFTPETDARHQTCQSAHACQAQGSSARVLPYQHDTEGDAAMQRYEYRLHYWVTCLQRAGSAYAFATLGSVMQLSLPHYAAVRGFPKRNGGEDFYLLNKLNKVGVVQSVHTRSPVILSSRRSHRVPFGTGPGVIDAEQYDTGNYLLPNPIAFDYLMAVQAQLPDLPQTDVLEQPDSRQILKAWSEQVCRKPDTLKADILCAALTKIGMERALVQFKGRFERHRTTVSQPIAAAAAHWWHLWFDAKKQLRLIRELQRHGIAALSLPEVHKQITGQPFTDLTRALQTLRGM